MSAWWERFKTKVGKALQNMNEKELAALCPYWKAMWQSSVSWIVNKSEANVAALAKDIGKVCDFIFPLVPEQQSCTPSTAELSQILNNNLNDFDGWMIAGNSRVCGSTVPAQNLAPMSGPNGPSLGPASVPLVPVPSSDPNLTAFIAVFVVGLLMFALIIVLVTRPREPVVWQIQPM